MSELTIYIPIGDWEEEYVDIECDVTSADAIIARLEEGISGPQAARLAIVAREREEAPGDILSGNKLLLNNGAAADISAMVGNRRKKVELENGAIVSIREWVAAVPKSEDEDDERDQLSLEETPVDDGTELVHWQSEKATRRAWDYLLNKVPGYAYGRLAIIAANGGDVRDAANQLVDKITEMVERLG